MYARANPYARDPALSQAFDSIAKMFAPPSGTDAAGWAAAAAKKAEAEQKQWIYDNATDPLAAQRSSLLGIQSYGNTAPGFMQTDATTRRGQDLTAQTSAANNVRDNNRAMAQTRFGPVAEGQTMPALPESLASMYGLPAQPEQRGVIKLGQNTIASLPGGEQLSGINRPQTMDEWTAQNAERMRQSGTLTDEQISDAAFGKQAPVVVMGPNGPAYSSPGAAARKQLPAAAAPSASDAKLVEGTAVVDGKPVQVFRTPNSPAYALADGTPLPGGTQVFDRATPQATQGDLKGTEFSDKNAIFYNRAAPASAAMNDLVGKGYVPSARDYELMLGGAGDVLPTSLSNNLVSPQGRQFYNSAMNFMLSVLRPDTGAAFGPNEFRNYARVFIPLPGDDPQTLTNKATARDTALAALQGTSRGAADKITQLMAAQGLEVPPEMAKRLQTTQAGTQAPAAPTRTMPAAGKPDPVATIAEARSAIQRGAPRAAVVERLRGMGIDPGGL